MKILVLMTILRKLRQYAEKLLQIHTVTSMYMFRLMSLNGFGTGEI